METPVGITIERIAQSFPPESQHMEFFKALQQFFQQHHNFPIASNPDTELNRIVQGSLNQKQCRSADLILLVLQGIWPIKPEEEGQVWKSLSELAGAVVQANIPEAERWWLLHQVADIFYNNGPMPGALDAGASARIAEPLRIAREMNSTEEEWAPIAKKKLSAVLDSLGRAA